MRLGSRKALTVGTSVAFGGAVARASPMRASRFGLGGVYCFKTPCEPFERTQQLLELARDLVANLGRLRESRAACRWIKASGEAQRQWLPPLVAYFFRLLASFSANDVS